MNETPVFLYVGNHAGYFLTHRLPIAQAMKGAGFEVHVAVPDQPDTLEHLAAPNALNTIQGLGYVVHGIPIRRGSTHPFRELRTLLGLLRLYRALRPDLVYHATVKPVIYGGIAARMTRVPAVINAITGLGYLFLDDTSVKTHAVREMARLAFGLALAHPNSHAVFQNQDDCDAFVRQHLVRPEKASVIRGSGVDTTKFVRRPEPDGTPVVMLPSRMLWDKGVGEFVDAAGILHTEGIDARFVLVGDTDPDNPRAIPRTQLQAWHDDGIVEWMGWRYDVAALLEQSHVVCLPSSYREGIPKALIEAAACGRPIVTTDTPGCREIVQHGVNGLLVPVRDATALAEALRRLINDPALRHRMGNQSREMAVAGYSVEVVVKATMQICRKLRAIPPAASVT